MPDGDHAAPGARGRTIAAYGVHVLTASGTAIGFLALLAAVNGQWSTMFLWLSLALVVDAVDGPLARRLEVGERLPRWSGETLDLVVDYLTYVFVPAYAIAAADVVPAMLAIPAALAILITGALYFADRNMKTVDNYFRGFPGVWNLAVFFMILLRLPHWINLAVVASLVILTFVPVPFVHPLRVSRYRKTGLALLAVGAALALIAMLRDMAPGPWVTGALCLIGLYFLGAGLLRRDQAA
jgi:phosphatidylcholine synthase